MSELESIEAPPAADNRVYTQQESAQAASELKAFKALEGRSSKRKRTRRLQVIIVIAVIVSLVGVAALLLKNYFSPPVEAFPPPTDMVTRGEFIDSISASGNLAAYEQVTITPEVGGTVQELHVAEGDTVEAGQLLFTLENPDLDKAINNAQRGLDSANLTLRSAQTARNDAGRAADQAWASYEAIKQAHANSQYLAPDDPLLETAPTQADVDAAYSLFQQSKTAVESAKLSLDGAQMGVTDAQTALDEAKATAEKRNVYSPISGLVVLNNLERGTQLATLATSGQVPMQIADVSQMRMTVSINEIDILGITPGMQAMVGVDAIEGYMTDAEVLRVASTSDGSDMMYYGGGGGGLVYYQVDLLIKEPDPQLKIGMSANADIVFLKLENVLIINSMALVEAGDYSFVQVQDEEGSIREVRVAVVATNGSQTVVEGDLHQGDLVLLNLGLGGGMGGDMGGGVSRPGGVIVY